MSSIYYQQPCKQTNKLVQRCLSRLVLADSANGEVRLIGGKGDGAGHVQIRDRNGRWSILCDSSQHGWGNKGANVACVQMGFTKGRAVLMGTRLLPKVINGLGSCPPVTYGVFRWRNKEAVQPVECNGVLNKSHKITT